MCYISWYIACYIAPHISIRGSSITRVPSQFTVVIFASFLPATFHSVCSSLARFRHGCLSLQLRLSDSNPALLTPAVAPHPNVDFIKPAAVASTIPAGSHRPLAVPKAVGQGWRPVPSHEAWRERCPAQDVASQAKVQAGEVRAAGSIVEHGHSVALPRGVTSPGVNVMGSKVLKKTKASSLCLLGV